MPQEECLFCGIVKGKVPSKKVYEDSDSLAFLDINPRNPGHTLVIPKKHFEDIFDMPYEEAGEIFEKVKKVAALVKNGTQAQGINILQSNGKVAGQMVSHIHFHIIPRFINEGPASLEGILQVKRMDEKSMDRIAETIKKASGEAEIEETKKSEEAEEPAAEWEEKKVRKKEKPKKEDEESGEKTEDEDLEEISFDF